MGTKSTFALSLFLFCLIPALAVAQTQVYTITDLGPLAPAAINTWGQVVGDYNRHAFLWTKFEGMRDLGTLSGGTFSTAAAINDLGIVTGTADGPGTVISPYPSIVPNQECNDLTQPFVWTPATGMQGLGTVGIYELFSSLLNCDYSFYGRGINASAQVVGDVPVSHDLYAYGFLWTSANGMTLLGDSWPPTFANGVSITGEIVGQNSDEELLGIGHATSWQNGVANDLGSLGGGPDVVDYASSANGVNDLGLVVGWSTISPVPCCGIEGALVHAVLWTPSRGMSDLGTLSGDTSSAALKINFFGKVIGSSGNTVYVWNEFANTPFEVIGRPFIWSHQRGMRDLNTLISPNSGWVLNSAADINIWGQIVGSGTLNGQPHGFLLTPRILF